MQALDAEIGNATALVIDGDAAWRSIVAAMLRNFGVRQVDTCRSSEEARLLLQAAARDIIVCADDPQVPGGAGAVTALRCMDLVPASTLVVLTCRDPARARRAQAIELADACLLHPYTEAAMRDQLLHARQRQHSLAEITAALRMGRHDEVDRLCRERHAMRGPFWVQALRLAGELHLRQANPRAAREMFEAVLHSRSLPWARLGLARALAALGDAQQALDLLQRLLADHPDHLEALQAWAELHAELARRQRATAPARQARPAARLSASERAPLRLRHVPRTH